MNYLVGMLAVSAMLVVFLQLVARFERGNWPSDRADSAGDALRELFWGRRAS